ncbi:MAG: HD domain-containing protein [Myxococcota bacterium]
MNNRQALLDTIGAHPQLSAVLEHVRNAAGDDASHDLDHTLRVAHWTLTIAGDAVEPKLAIAAALLHDVINVPKNDPRRAQASTLCAEHVRTFLPGLGFDPDEIELIADAVRDHSFSRGAVPASALGRALQDADRLEALGAIGLMRTFATGARMGARFFHNDDPWGDDRSWDDQRYSIDHFFTKLLRLPSTMLTERGRAEGRRRVRLMETFLQELGREIMRPPPDECG